MITRSLSTARVAAGLVVVTLALLVLPSPAAQAGQGSGNPRLVLSTQTAQAARVTDITVSGVDYLVPPHAPGTDVFGGVYVFFGWVADANTFGPSNRNSQNNNGVMGVSYIYPGDGGDPGTRDPGTGTMRMVSFTAGGESGKATEFHMDRDGNWTTKLRIYSSVFSAQLPSGEIRTIDCMKLTHGRCGVFTVGAHSKTSSTNEKFVPVTFTGTSPTSPPAAASPGTSGGGSTGSSGGTSVPKPSADGSASSGGTTGGWANGPDGWSPPTGVAPGSTSVGQGNARNDRESGSGGGPASPADDEVSLGEAGTRSGPDRRQMADADPIVATVSSVESDGTGAAVWIAAVGLPIAAAVIVIRRRSRRSRVPSDQAI